MQEEPSLPQPDTQPLIKDVAGHLFTFEEKIFGISLTHLLTDLGVLTSSVSFTGSLPLLPRVILCVVITLVALVLVHGRVHGLSLGFWCSLLVRSKLVPQQAIWLPQKNKDKQTGKKRASRLPSVQQRWVPIDTLAQGLAGKSIRWNKREVTRDWMIFEIEGKNIGLLPVHEQSRAFQRFERFLCGLSFHLQFLSFTEQLDPQTAPPFLRQKEALKDLAATPRLQAGQAATLQAQAQQMLTCTRTRHFLVVSASSAEPALQDPQGMPPSVLGTLLRVLPKGKTPPVTRSQIREQLRIRASIVCRAIQQLDLRVFPLDDQALLQLFAQCLAPGSPPPSFVSERIEEQTTLVNMSNPREITHTIRQEPTTMSRSHPTAVSVQAETAGGHGYKKRLRGVHGTFSYLSPHAHTRLETGPFALADLLAPSRIDVQPDVLQIQTGSGLRYTRTLVVTGYGHHLSCGWLDSLHHLGVPLLVCCHLEPIDSRLMLLKLEQALTRLESQRLADQEHLRLSKADHRLEAEQIRRVTHALAAKELKIFDVSLLICIHAGSRERLEQRSRYVLSHLHNLQIQARSATLQQDLAWQSALPVGIDLLQHWKKLTSDVVATFLPATSGVVGTPTGVFLGYTGSELARRPVYLNPWSPEKKMANPHVVVIGETGQGKSWLGKTLATGFMGLGLADVVVLDKDDDYLPLHQALGNESQRYTLARTCPINLFDLPFGPTDVNEESGDPLADFFDNVLLTGLSLLVTDEDARLSRNEAAYQMAVARACYASKGITTEAIRHHPETVLLPPPTMTDFLATMHSMPAASREMQQSLLERLETASYLFHGGQTSISLEKPLTIFSIKDLDSKWYALMTFIISNFLSRHRALRQDDRYLAYIVEEASYLLKHAAGRRYLEHGSRGFRKRGIAQITLSQHPRDFLEAGQVVLSNAGTVFYLGMQRTAVEKLHLPEALERLLIESPPGKCVLRIGNEYAPLTIWSNPIYRALFTTDPVERRAQRQQARREVSNQTEKDYL